MKIRYFWYETKDICDMEIRYLWFETKDNCYTKIRDLWYKNKIFMIWMKGMILEWIPVVMTTWILPSSTSFIAFAISSLAIFIFPFGFFF